MGLLRLFLASLVLISHLGISIGGINPGVSAVIVFYMLAGHVVCRLWQRRPERGAALWFYQDRFWRIIPLYGVTVVLAVLLWSYGAQSYYFSREPGLNDWLANILIIPLNYYMYSGQETFTLVPPAWSLAVELQFYLLVPLILGRTGLVVLATLLSLSVFICAQLGWLNTDVFGYRLLAGVAFVFLAGTLLGDSRRWAKALLALLWLASLFYVIWLFGWGIRVPFNTEVALGLTMGLPLLILLQRYPFRGPWQILQRKAGDLSYGLFLLHFPVIWLLQLAGWSEHPSIGAVWLLSAAFAWLAHYCVERPVWQRFRTRALLERPAIGTP